VTIGAINLLTVGTNNSLIVANVAAMAGGILAGAVALIYEWALVSGESLNIYPPRIKNYLIAATIKDDTKIYPGFGVISLVFALQCVIFYLKTSLNK